MKKIRFGKKINQYKKTYHKEMGALIGLLLGFITAIAASTLEGTETYTTDYNPVAVVVNARVPETEFNKPSKKVIEDKIKHYFPRSWRDMLPVAYAESRLNTNAKNWNCYYNKDETTVYLAKVKGSHSTACHKGHRDYAWSVDCGVMQLNVKGKVCPNDTLDQHLQKAAKLSTIQGKEAWVTYKTGAHLKYK